MGKVIAAACRVGIWANHPKRLGACLSKKAAEAAVVSQFDCGGIQSGLARGFAFNKRNATDLVNCSNV